MACNERTRKRRADTEKWRKKFTGICYTNTSMDAARGKPRPSPISLFPSSFLAPRVGNAQRGLDKMDSSSISTVFHFDAYANLTASKILKQMIDALDADVSELDPDLVFAVAISVPVVFVLMTVSCAWFLKCRPCCFCLFGRKLVPNTDAKDNDILGDEDFDGTDEGDGKQEEEEAEDGEDVEKKNGVTSDAYDEYDDDENGQVHTDPPLDPPLDPPNDKNEEQERIQKVPLLPPLLPLPTPRPRTRKSGCRARTGQTGPANRRGPFGSIDNASQRNERNKEDRDCVRACWCVKKKENDASQLGVSHGRCW